LSGDNYDVSSLQPSLIGGNLLQNITISAPPEATPEVQAKEAEEKPENQKTESKLVSGVSKSNIAPVQTKVFFENLMYKYPVVYYLFDKFAKQEWSLENLHCYDDILGFKKLPIIKKGKAIYNQYLKGKISP